MSKITPTIRCVVKALSYCWITLLLIISQHDYILLNKHYNYGRFLPSFHVMKGPLAHHTEVIIHTFLGTYFTLLVPWTMCHKITQKLGLQQKRPSVIYFFKQHKLLIVLNTAFNLLFVNK